MEEKIIDKFEPAGVICLFNNMGIPLDHTRLCEIMNGRMDKTQMYSILRMLDNACAFVREPEEIRPDIIRQPIISDYKISPTFYPAINMKLTKRLEDKTSFLNTVKQDLETEIASKTPVDLPDGN